MINAVITPLLIFSLILNPDNYCFFAIFIVCTICKQCTVVNDVMTRAEYSAVIGAHLHTCGNRLSVVYTQGDSCSDSCPK